MKNGEVLNNIVTLLLELDIDPNLSDEKKTTRLHQATLHRDVQMEYLLLSGKGNPKLKNLDGIAPLHHIIVNSCISSIISMLLKYGADINEQDVNGNTASFSCLF
jgi:ankyrin repeat protein